MRFGINLLYLLPGISGGVETYADGLLTGLSQLDNENEFFIFVNQNAAQWRIPDKNNFIRVVCPVEGLKRHRRYFYEQFQFPKLLKEYRIDLVHSLGYVCPLRSPCPSVVTIPDLNFIDIAQTLSAGKRIVLKFFSTQSAKRSDHIITISNFSKQRLCNVLSLHEEKITVTLLASNKRNNIDTSITTSALLNSYCVKKPYIVAFAGGAIHKNIPRLLSAFALSKISSQHKLVLIGTIPANVDSKKLAGNVIATGYVPDEHILPLLSSAELFILPSLYEGFGMPVLEAQQAGVPVLCSTAGSLPEVAGESAVLFNPYSIDDMAEKIRLVLGDHSLRDALRHKGLANVQRFTWEKTAQETLSVYEQVCKKGSQ